MKKALIKILCVLLSVALLLGFCACDKRTPEKQKYSGVFYDAFDTAVSITAYCDSEAEFSELFEEAKELFFEYHRLYDIYNNYEGLANAKTLNDNAGGEAVVVPAELINLLLYAKELYKETNGHVNIAMGEVLKQWHDARAFADAHPELVNPKSEMDVVASDVQLYIPSPVALAEGDKHCNIDDIVIDEALGRVQLLDPVMSIDLGAVAKGYAAEQLAKRFIAEGRDNILIQAGGNVRAIGKKPDGSPWLIAVQNPEKDEKNPYAETLSIESLSAVTSGSYERYFEINGIRYHHIINKDTLMPENYYKSVTIITEDSAYADALSTAVFNMEIGEGMAFVNSAEGVYAMWILASGEKVYSDGFAAYLK